jgi:hypothetical protein
LLTNSHDGRSSLQLKFTPVRVVCANTLTLALSRGQAVRIPHRKDVMSRLKAAGVLLGLHDFVVPADRRAEVPAEHVQEILSSGFDSIEKAF